MQLQKMGAPMSGIDRQAFENIAGNWIAVARNVRTHHLVGFGQPVKPADPKRGAYSKTEAWLDLLMLAAWKEGVPVMNKGQKMTLGTGQLMAGYSWLADRWNWTVKTVRTFLAKLMGSDEAMIAERTEPKHGQEKGKQKGNQVRVLTICNYRKYQIANEILGIEKGQAKGKRAASQGQESNTVEQGNNTTKIPPVPPAGGERNGGKVSGIGLAVAAVAASVAAVLPAAAEPSRQPVEQASLFGETQSPKSAPSQKPTRRGRGDRTLLPEDWILPSEWRDETKAKFNATDAQIDRQAERFKRWWLSPDSKNRLKADWKATWLNWIDSAQERGQLGGKSDNYSFGKYVGATL
jgi:hypothetical protein